MENEKEKEKQGDLESWGGYIGSNCFLKADDVDDGQIFVCTDVSIDDENNRPRLTLESDKKVYFFDLNVTNSNAIKDAGVKSPKEVIGKKITFKKVMANNPTTKKEVESLRIKSIA